MKKKIALIGVNGFGKNHFEHLSKLAAEEIFELSAAVVRSPDKVPNQLEKMNRMGTRIYSDSDSMFAAEKGKIDLVCIPTGIGTHEPLTVAAL